MLSAFMRILISSGEASGDTYGAQLIEALKRRQAGVEIFGAGGERMRAAGLDSTVRARDISVVGIVEVLTHLPKIYREYKKLLREIDRRRPDAAVLIDFPDWNLRLAQELHRRKIPVVYYVSPQLWAWRPGRIEQVKKFVDRMLVIFPFEATWYRERGVEAEYVGHPLADMRISPPPASFSTKRVGEDGFEGWIALLPGSRRKEVAMNLPEMLKAVSILDQESEGRLDFALPVASTLDREWIQAQLDRVPPLPITLLDDARFALANARAAIVASGTATVEATLIGTPFVMVYRVSPVSYKIGRGMVKVPFFAMPNLIAGREVVPELVQDDFTAEKVVACVRQILPDGAARQRMLNGFAEIRGKLTVAAEGTVAERVAAKVLRLLGQQAPGVAT